jgi:hypothetical protein
MLFVLNKTRSEVFDLIRQLGGDEGKTVLLVGDAAYYAARFMSARFQEPGTPWKPDVSSFIPMRRWWITMRWPR